MSIGTLVFGREVHKVNAVEGNGYATIYLKNEALWAYATRSFRAIHVNEKLLDAELIRLATVYSVGFLNTYKRTILNK